MGGPREIANESGCGKSVASANEECTMIDTVPGSSVKKDIEKPFCGSSESVSPLAGERAVLFFEILSNKKVHEIFAALLWINALLQNFMILLLAPLARHRQFRKGPATPSETLPAVLFSALVAETSLDRTSELQPSRFSLRHGTFGTPPGIDPRGV